MELERKRRSKGGEAGRFLNLTQGRRLWANNSRSQGFLSRWRGPVHQPMKKDHWNSGHKLFLGYEDCASVSVPWYYTSGETELADGTKEGGNFQNHFPLAV